MTDIERQVKDALSRFDRVEGAPDLLDRIELAVEEDERRRLRTRRVVAAASIAVIAAIGSITWMLQGGTDMDWWILELITTAALFGIAFVLGPLIRRYGKSYVADAFAPNVSTGKTFIVLADVAYYLIFTAYILITTSFQQRTAWGVFGDVTADQVQHEVVRIGGILAIIGALHAVNLFLMPVVGRLLSRNRQE
jgi:hypothetical protein